MTRGREKFDKFKIIIHFLVSMCLFIPLKYRIKLFESCRMIKGYVGITLRYILLKSIARKCGDNVSIHPGVYLLNPQNASFGSNVSVHPMCYIEAYGSVVIENDVSIAHGVTIMSTEHVFDEISIAINDQGTVCNEVIIKSNVWIGAKATILAGKKIETGCVIGAGSVVTKNVEKNLVVAGVPAKRINIRK